MRLTIHNVGHGLCVSLIHENGNVMLWDCGQDEENKPSQFFPAQGIQRITNFFVTNYDEDHISDLPNLRSKAHIETLFRNESISSSQLHQLKIQQSGEISLAMQSMLDMMKRYNSKFGTPACFPEVDYQVFCNRYIYDFNDTNNISLVTFMKCKELCFIIPGDLETSGWKCLLRNPNFINALQCVNVFIASHHGRENGYCQEVFDICKPNIIVFSDSEIKHATQEMASQYRKHAIGTMFNGTRRYILSTRKDGSIFWDI